MARLTLTVETSRLQAPMEEMTRLFKAHRRSLPDELHERVTAMFDDGDVVHAGEIRDGVFSVEPSETFIGILDELRAVDARSE